MGYLGWRSIEYLGDLRISWLDNFYGDVAKRSPESLKISIDILSSPFISKNLPRYPKISNGANSQMAYEDRSCNKWSQCPSHRLESDRNTALASKDNFK